VLPLQAVAEAVARLVGVTTADPVAVFIRMAKGLRAVQPVHPTKMAASVHSTQTPTVLYLSAIVLYRGSSVLVAEVLFGVMVTWEVAVVSVLSGPEPLDNFRLQILNTRPNLS
tara:strand:- start:1635 stop:1973 length:339 start_codon:yes stop_codon:yes gene_type:complete